MDLKRFTKEKSPWVKTKAKTGNQKEEKGEFGDEKKKILTDSDKGSWFDQPSQIGEEKPGVKHRSTASESVVGSVEKNNGNELARRKKGYEREPLPSTSQDYSSPEISYHSRVPPCNRASALAPRFPLFSSTIALFLFSLVMTTAQKRPCRKRDQNYGFPAKLLFAYCERLGFPYFIGWRLSVLTSLSDKACHVHKSELWRAKTRIRFSRESFLFKRIYKVCRIRGFS